MLAIRFMRPADLLRQTSFRLALGVTMFILVALILASGVAYGVMRSQLMTRQDARVTEIFETLRQTSLQGDQVDLIDTIMTRIAASPDRATVYQLKDRTGQVLASNMGGFAEATGWSTVSADSLGIVTDYPYRLFSGPTGTYTLSVGLTNADLDDLREIILAAFGWSALFAFVVAIGAGAVLATRVQHRLALVEAVTQRVAMGDLAARLPVTKRGDDLDQISRAINVSLARLGGLVEAMRQVSTDIAHDLRTPLNKLRIHIEDASQKTALGVPAGDDLSAAITQSETIDQTFSALLRIAQIEAGARRERFAPIDISALLANVAEVYVDVAEDKGQILTCAAGTPAWISGDKDLLTQMFANLIENAIRHCPKGTAINCRVQPQGDKIVASISDTGPGIPVDEHDKVLRRLYRLEKSRTTEGSGLGLALVKAVGDLHGAALRLRDAAPGLWVDLSFDPVAAR